jgi:hypothetical protein
MEKRGLLFIPDISGFTRFVTETEIDHSRSIIQELLEVLVNANQIGLEVSEIEGDAILFYKYGESPDLPALYAQVEKMFCEFHRHLGAYEISRYCQCRACRAAINLTLKVISHYGEFTGYNVKNFNKLIGKDVIVAHQLLKNDIPQHEYWLVTDNLVHDSPDQLTQWMKWDSSTKKTETVEKAFHYTQLSQLKKQASLPVPAPGGITHPVKVFSITREFDTHMIQLFHATGDFKYRHRWQPDVKRVEELGHFLPRVGMRCRLVTDHGDMVIQASGYSFKPDRIQFNETDERKINSVFYTLEKIDNFRTRLSIDVYQAKNFARQALFQIIHEKKLSMRMQQSMVNLETLIKELKVPPEY